MFYHRSTAGFLSSMLLMCFCWILSEITWKCCAVFPLLQKEMANLWHLSWVPLQLFFFAKVAIMPSTRAGEWPASLDLERTHVSCRCVRQGRASGEQLAPLSLTSCTFLGTAVCRTSTWGLEQKDFNLWLVQSKVGALRLQEPVFFLVVPVQLL